MATYFKLVRWKNLLLIVFVFFVLKFSFFSTLQIQTKLSIVDFLLLLLSVLAITAAGYIINDIFDVKTDLINKPTKVIVSQKISLETAKKWYKTTNTVGIVLGIALCIKISKPTHSFIFIGISLLLYYYSKKIKTTPFIGNFLVSLLIAFSVLIFPLFEIELIAKNNIQNLATQIIWMLFFFAFSLNLIREIVKDIEDVNGDYSLKMNTLPILLGSLRTRSLVLFLCIVPIGLLLFIILKYSSIYKFTVLYLLLFVLMPLLYFTVKLRSAKKKTEFHKLSLLLKIIMLLGINSLLIFSITL
ncbi:MAG: geranylgeranylglycerol-phosphate geranylgeranyltransferase [Bacteroidetes bacterium]|nr:geranylgeranylglycerol-phosphate geranylgeranyltransferase [Bacteroidota bacterium]